MKATIRGLAWALIPLGLALIGWALVKSGLVTNLVFLGRYQFDLLALFVTLGAAVSALLAVLLGGRTWLRQRADRQLESERQAHGRDRQLFLRRLDHELKNPLTTIRLGIANLQESASLGQVETASLGRIAAQVQRMGALVEDLRLLTELNEQNLEQAQIELSEVLENAVALACHDLEAQSQRITLAFQQIPWPVTYVFGDPDLLVLAFRNLIENAMKFSRLEDRVEVRVSENGRDAIVEVADTGCGIDPQELPHIFEELYRGQNARELPGSGLGLSLVKRIVDLHGGRVEVRSRLKQGTVASIYLPLRQ